MQDGSKKKFSKIKIDDETSETEADMEGYLSQFNYQLCEIQYRENDKGGVQMSLEEFKKKVEENLIIVAGEKEAKETMKLYEEYFPIILEEGWTVEGITPALLMRFY